MPEVKPRKLTITLAQARAWGACGQTPGATTGIARAKANLPPDWSENDPIDLLTVLSWLPLGSEADFWWCMAKMPEVDRNSICQMIAADIAESILPNFEKVFPNDDRPRKAIEITRAVARGESDARSAYAAAYAADAAAYAADADAAAYAAYAAAYAAYAAAYAADAAAYAAYATAYAADAAAYAADAAADAADADAAAARSAQHEKNREIIIKWLTPAEE